MSTTFETNTPPPPPPAAFDQIVSGRRRDDTRPVRRAPRLRVRSTAKHAAPGTLAAKLKAFGIGVRFGSMAGAALIVLAVSVAAGTK